MQASYLRATAERMDPIDAVDWLLEVIANSQPDNEIKGLISLMDWGFTRQQAHFLRILLAAGDAGAAYDRLSWELSCNGEPSSRYNLRVIAANVRRKLLLLEWPVRLVNLHSRGYQAVHPAGWLAPIRACQDFGPNDRPDTGSSELLRKNNRCS